MSKKPRLAIPHLCVLWNDGTGRTSNVPVADVKPINFDETDLYLDQEVIAKWKKTKARATIYSLSAISERPIVITRKSKAKLFDFDEFDNDDEENATENGSTASGDPSDSRILGPENPLDIFSEAEIATNQFGALDSADYDVLNTKLDTVTTTLADVVDRIRRMENNNLTQSQAVKSVCHKVMTEQVLLCQHITAHTPVIARIDGNVANVHTILTGRINPVDPIAMPTPATSSQIIPTTYRPILTTPAPILTTPARATPQTLQHILDPPVINDNGDAVISAFGESLAVPLEIFNSASREGTGPRFAIKLIGHCYTEPYLASNSYISLIAQRDCKIIVEEANRRFPTTAHNKLRKAISNKCQSCRHTNANLPTTVAATEFNNNNPN